MNLTGMLQYIERRHRALADVLADLNQLSHDLDAVGSDKLAKRVEKIITAVREEKLYLWTAVHGTPDPKK